MLLSRFGFLRCGLMTACFNSAGKTPDNSERLTMRSKTGKSVSKHCFFIDLYQIWPSFPFLGCFFGGMFVQNIAHGRVILLYQFVQVRTRVYEFWMRYILFKCFDINLINLPVFDRFYFIFWLFYPKKYLNCTVVRYELVYDTFRNVVLSSI